MENKLSQENISSGYCNKPSEQGNLNQDMKYFWAIQEIDSTESS